MGKNIIKGRDGLQYREVKYMAGTMIDYLKTYGTRSFREEPLNEVDSLILCQFAYLKFDGMVPGVSENKRSVYMRDLYQHSDFEKLFKNTMYARSNRRLFETMLSSRRFCELRMNSYINIVELERQFQFSAITFTLEDGTVYVAYRGTDESLVGWKEDLNMAFLDPIPGQEYSVKYINTVAKKMNRPFYVGGHSKGGNLAVYASMNCAKSVQDRIIKIYNMDGPSFRPQVLEKYHYEAIKDRTVKIIPHSSLVGMLFEQSMDYRVVKSRALGLLQHDPYSWKVRYGRFVDIEQVLGSQRIVDETLNAWILSLNEEQIRVFVDTLYLVLCSAKKDNLLAFSTDLGNSIGSIVGAIKEVDEETKQMIGATLKDLVRLAQLRVKEEITRKPRQLIDNITQKRGNIEKEESL